MSILSANVKLYNPFGNRYLFIFLLCQLFALFVILGAALCENHLIEEGFEKNQLQLITLFCLFASMLILGVTTASIQLDILTKPFSSCLPNHNIIPGRIIFLTGIITNLFYCIVFLLLPHPEGLKGILYIIMIPAIGLLSYFITIFVTFYAQRERQKGAAIMFCVAIIFPLLFMLNNLNVFKFSIDYFVFYSTIPFILFDMLLLFALWKMLVHPDLKRIYFSKDYGILSMRDSLPMVAQLHEIHLTERLPDRVEKESSIEILFLKVVKRFPYLNINRSIVGRLYCMLDRHYTINERYFGISFFIGILLATLLLFFTGYHLTPENFEEVPASDIASILVLIVPCFVVHSIFIPVPHNQLLPTGRSDQFWSSLIVWLIHPMIAIIWSLIIIFLSWLVGNHMPDFTLAGFYYFTYHPLESSLILWVLVIIPVFDTSLHYLEDRYGLIKMFLLILMPISLALFILLTAHTEYRLISIVLLITLANGFFINRLMHYWFKKDLVLFI